jgi:hypothetical protein
MTPGPDGYKVATKLKVILLFVLGRTQGLRAALRGVSHIGHTRLSEARPLRGKASPRKGTFFVRLTGLLGGGQMVDPFCAEARVAVAE